MLRDMIITQAIHLG